MKQLILCWTCFCMCVIASAQNKNNILSTAERGNYAYFIYVDSVPAHNILRALPLGAKVQLNYGKTLETHFTHNTWPDSNKMVFWYRHNMCLQKAIFNLLKNKQIVCTTTFWPNADLVFIDLAQVTEADYAVEIVLDGAVVERKDLEFGFKK
jgi:hypothetical protein